ncbi:Uncharacterized protein Fot_29378 [Forsythia ovata]|uniref:Uncharacterized protein n=1 Tax=Forsythia ovata TaxID=205694 RepID=A0ABD1TRP5_9LAMI
MDTQKRQRRRQIQRVGLFWTMVIQEIVIYDGIKRRARHIPRAPHRNWACLGLYREVVTNATINNSPYDKDNVKQWYSFFQLTNDQSRKLIVIDEVMEIIT